MNKNDQFAIAMQQENMTEKRKPGRPTVEGSARQIRMAMLEQKKADPNFRLGRPVDPNSPRQQKLAELMERRAAGLAQRGRPKMTEEAKAEAKKQREEHYAKLALLLKDVNLDQE
jgi:hypothetical protein